MATPGKTSFREEWTSLWVNQYSTSSLYHSRSNSSPSSGSHSRDDSLFSHPAGPIDLTSKTTSPSAGAQFARSPSSSRRARNEFKLAPAPRGKPVARTNTVRSRPPRPLPSPRHSPSYSADSIPRVLPPVPSSSRLSRTPSGRKRPVPVLLSTEPSAFAVSPLAEDGPLILTPSWTKAFADADAAAPSSPSTSSSSASDSSCPATPEMSVVSLSPDETEQRIDHLIHMLASESIITAPTPAAASPKRKLGKPTQDLPSSAVLYEERLLSSEGEEVLYFEPEETEEFLEEDEEDGVDEAEDWELLLIQETHRQTLCVKRGSLVRGYSY